MAISDELIKQAIVSLTRLDRIEMNPDSLVEDCMLLAKVFDDEAEFKAAVANTYKALVQLSQGMVDASGLKYDFEDWQSYHYQHKISQGARADMRIMYQRSGEAIRVRGFGHRDVPSDFYKRMRKAR